MLRYGSSEFRVGVCIFLQRRGQPHRPRPQILHPQTSFIILHILCISLQKLVWTLRKFFIDQWFVNDDECKSLRWPLQNALHKHVRIGGCPGHPADSHWETSTCLTICTICKIFTMLDLSKAVAVDISSCWFCPEKLWRGSRKCFEWNMATFLCRWFGFGPHSDTNLKQLGALLMNGGNVQ